MSSYHFLYLAGALIFFLLPVVMHRGRVFLNVQRPINLFSLFYGFTYFLIPYIGLSSGTYWHQSQYSDDTLITSWFLLMGFGFSAVLTYYALNTFRRRGESPGFNYREWRVYSNRFLALGFGLLLIPVLAALAGILRSIGVAGIGGFLANRIVLLSGNGYGLIALGWPAVLLLVLYANSFVRRALGGPKISVLAVTALAALSILAGLITGSRTAALVPVVFLVLASMLLRGRGVVGRRTQFVFVGIAALILTSGAILGSVRQQVSAQRSVEVSTQDISAATTLVRSFGEYENVWWLVENMQSSELLYGKTFAAALVGYVPRQFWPDKPLGGGPYLRNMIIPGSYDLSSGQNLTSYTTGLPAESMMNFGYLGFFIVGILYGLALWLINVLFSRINNPIVFAIWFVLLYRGLFALKAEFFGNMTSIFVSLLPLLFLFVLARMAIRRAPALPKMRQSSRA